MPMTRRIAAFLGCLLFSLYPLAANGTGEQGQPATGLENWESEIDLTAKKAGKYNILITGTDRAGNVSYGGPINIYIDPKSDLPQVSISNPLPLMRVGGDLNIVGTCVDDDEVGKVEISIDGGEFLEAIGTEFWSYYLDGKTLPDGRHTITVRGIDNKGTTGSEVSVQFDLDRNKPVSIVESMASGALVSGKLKLQGVAMDANGIREVWASMDQGKTFSKLKISPNKAKDKWSFSISLDSTKQPDGPFVIWLKSVDQVGSVGFSPFLLFIDNTKPAVKLVSPGPDEAVNGTFQVAWSAYDLVGLKSLTWKFGNDQSGELAFKPGNPYYSVVVKAPVVKAATKVNFTIVATDVSGNVISLVTPIKVDSAADLPVTTLSGPVEGQAVEGDFWISGGARDDDGIASVKWSIDGAAPVEVPCTGSFRIPVTGVANGKHSVTVTAVDAFGREGLPVKVGFLQNGAAPLVSFTTLSGQPFIAGTEVAPDAGAKLEGIISSAAKVASAAWQIGSTLNGTLPAGKAGDIPFSIALPSTGPYGIVDVSVTVKDEFGREASTRSFVYISDYSRIRREPQFDLADPRVRDDGKVSLGMDAPLQIAFLVEDVEKAEFVPATDIVSLSREGNILQVTALKEGTSAPTAIRVTTTKKHVFTSTAWTFVTDTKAPVIQVSTAPSKTAVKADFSVKGTVRDGVGVDALRWRVFPNGEFQAVPLKAGAFDLALKIADLPEGPSAVEFEAADLAGNKARALFPVVKDTTAPSLQTLTPVDRLDAELAVAGMARDPSGIAKVDFSADGATWTTLGDSAVFTHSYNPVQFPNARYRVTDRAGNSGTFDAPHFSVPMPMPVPAKGPALLILSPLTGSTIGNEVVLAIRAESAAGLASIAISLDTIKDSLDPATGPVWVKRIPLEGLKAAKSLVLRVTATDTAKGSATAQVTLVPNPAADAPVVEIVSPAEGAAPDALPQLGARARSDYGIASLSYSVDGGAFQSIEGAGFLAAELSGLSAGTHSVAVKAVASNGLESAAVTRSFKVVGPAARASFSLVSGKDGAPQSLVPGMTAVISGTSLTGTIDSPNGFASGLLALDDGTDLKAAFKKGATANETTFSAFLPATLPYERVGFRLKVVDALGLESQNWGFFYRVAPAAESRVDPGIITLADSLSTEGGSPVVRLSDKPLSLRFVGRPIADKGVTIAPDPKGIVSVTYEGRMLSLNPGTEGITAPITLTVKTVDGDTFTFGPFIAMVDRAAPSLEIADPAEDAWLKDKLALKAKASDPNGIASVEWSLDGGQTWTPAKLAADGSVNETIDLSSLADGPFSLSVRASDKTGKKAMLGRAYNKDTVAPTGLVVIPGEGDLVNGTITLASVFKDAGGSLSTLEYSTDGKAWEAAEAFSYMTKDVELAKVGNDPKKVLFRSRDKSGNEMIASPLCVVEGEKDLPVTMLQLPQENEVQRADFTISGVILDDDGVKAVIYKLDGGKDFRVELDGYSFSIPMPLAETTDNEHTVEIWAEDIYGVTGPKVLRKYRVSKAEPAAAMMSPPLESTVKGVIQLEGIASDANGIGKVAVSVDNALSFNLADVAEMKATPDTAEWKYRLDTRALADGLHSIYVRPTDKYDTDGFFATLINIDNSPPTVTLDQPADGSSVSGILQISGRVFDSVSLSSVTLDFNRILNAEGRPVTATDSRSSLNIDLGVEPIITRPIDIMGLDEGVYNLRIRALDKADNQALATRTVTVVRKKRTETVDLMFPLKGEKLSGEFSVMAQVRTEKPVATALVFMDGKQVGSSDVNEDGYFSYKVTPAELEDGPHSISARVVNAAGDTINSADIPFTYKRNGPWITVENFAFGTYLPERPYLKGKAGWYDDAEAERSKKDNAALAKERKVVAIDISMDNGKSFLPASGASSWKFRLETQDYHEGSQYLIVRATYANGEKAFVKTILNLDKTVPKVSILAPQEDDHLNEKIGLIGTASDETRLGQISVLLRRGDKAGYEVLSFIQGLFLEGHALGATFGEVGAGVTFFDDAVKLMATYGLGVKEQRYGGNVIGVKLLANISYIPFSFFLGPDWSFLSANIAVGAGFSRFDDTQAGTPQILGAVLAQLEFPTFTFKKAKMFSKISFYSEFSAWFVASEVVGETMPRMAFGGRVNVF